MIKNNKLSAQKYFKTRVRKLPLLECLINTKYKEIGLAQVFISRKQPSGKNAYALFLLDIFCLGLKDSVYSFNIDMDEYKDLTNQLFGNEPFNSIDIIEAHNLVYGTIDCAEEIGFKPHKSFAISEYILNPDLIDDGIDDIELGKDGKPMYVSGSFDNVNQIIKTLERTVGKGNFEFLSEVS
jgi:hypothetical protein